MSEGPSTLMTLEAWSGPRGAACMISNDAVYEPLDEPDGPRDPVGIFYAWWRGDPLPALPRVDGLATGPTDNTRLVARVAGAEAAELDERLRQGHRPWLARIAGDPVGCGWVATTEAAIGELSLAFTLPPGNRYLWDFVTLPPWRGHGVYPLLLQAIVSQEDEADRFWVGHDLANVPSARGVTKAGFRAVCTAYWLPNGDLTLAPCGPIERVAAAAALLDLSITGRPVARRA